MNAVLQIALVAMLAWIAIGVGAAAVHIGQIASELRAQNRHYDIGVKKIEAADLPDTQE